MKYPARIAAGIALALGALAVNGCTEPEPWNVRDISGLMPDLEFELTRAETGKTVTEAAFDDKVKVMYFGFTSCPDMCPLTMARMSQALGQMDEETADEVRILFVSVDPERDTPERLAQYVDSFGERFVGLRGEIPYLRDLTKRYRTTFGYGKPDDSGFYDVSHSNAAFIFDRSGEIRLLAREDDDIDAIAADLERLVEEGGG
ncbi:MAG: SCO family protein [Halofilum sp. (in: g-proteobacteria)]|nr:SCO family protein [Halofilum sp. (in: g-proteobacteria)]